MWWMLYEETHLIVKYILLFFNTVNVPEGIVNSENINKNKLFQ